MSEATQHAGLTAERWGGFSFDHQVLMVGNEMNRAMHLLEAGEWTGARRCYERILQLVDLTAAATPSASRRREILRWRDLTAALYLDARPSLHAHQAAFRCLLRFTPVASAQIPLLLGGSR